MYYHNWRNISTIYIYIYARVVDHLAVRDVAHGAPLGGGSTLHANLR